MKVIANTDSLGGELDSPKGEETGDDSEKGTATIRTLPTIAHKKGLCIV